MRRLSILPHISILRYGCFFVLMPSRGRPRVPPHWVAAGRRAHARIGPNGHGMHHTFLEGHSSICLSRRLISTKSPFAVLSSVMNCTTSVMGLEKSIAKDDPLPVRDEFQSQSEIAAGVPSWSWRHGPVRIEVVPSSAHCRVLCRRERIATVKNALPRTHRTAAVGYGSEQSAVTGRRR